MAVSDAPEQAANQKFFLSETGRFSKKNREAKARTGVIVEGEQRLR
jgi:hypothetical protein